MGSMSDHSRAEGRLPGGSPAPPADPDGTGSDGTARTNGAPPTGATWAAGNGGTPPGDDHGAAARVSRRIPEATVARLPVYLRALVEMAETKVVTVSSERLAEMAGVNAAKVRKDLSYLGSYGTRGVGYEVEYLLLQISRILGLTRDSPVVIVGVGNLGHALAKYRGFAARGFRIVALVDADPSKVGEAVGDLVVRPLDDLPRIAAEEEEGVAIGIIATPASAAQDVADRLVAAGVSSILNFAPAIVTVPRGVSVRKVDLSIELQILSFYQQRRAANGRTPEGDDGLDAVGVGGGDAAAAGA
jgi:redox-sensing transcriptional repressor